MTIWRADQFFFWLFFGFFFLSFLWVCVCVSFFFFCFFFFLFWCFFCFYPSTQLLRAYSFSDDNVPLHQHLIFAIGSFDPACFYPPRFSPGVDRFQCVRQKAGSSMCDFLAACAFLLSALFYPSLHLYVPKIWAGKRVLIDNCPYGHDLSFDRSLLPSLGSAGTFFWTPPFGCVLIAQFPCSRRILRCSNAYSAFRRPLFSPSIP